MIEPTDEMVQLALDVFLATPTDSIASIDAGMAKALTAAFAIVERDYRLRRRPFIESRPHAFLRGDDPRFGSAFGGACVAVFDGTVCGFPEPFHRPGQATP